MPLPIAVPSFLELPCRNNLLFSVKAERQIFIRYERSCRGCRHHLDIMPVNFSPPSWLFPPSANGTCRSPSGSGRFNSNFLRSTAGGCFLLFLLLFSFFGGEENPIPACFLLQTNSPACQGTKPLCKKKNQTQNENISSRCPPAQPDTVWGWVFFCFFLCCFALIFTLFWPE